jgi:hypothetical protein
MCRLLFACLFLQLACLLAANKSPAHGNDFFVFTDRSNSTLSYFVAYRVAKVVDANNDHHGSATLIDKEHGLAVTAWHVVRDKPKPLRLVFAAIGGDPPPEVAVDVIAKDVVNDVAILKATTLIPPIVAQAEAWLAQINPQETYHLYGYSKDLASLSPASGKLAKDEECKYHSRAGTYNGDSGSPAFSNEGLIAGIVLRRTGIEDSWVLPLSCVANLVFDTLMMDQAYLGHVTGLWDDIRSYPNYELIARLRPSSSHPEWINNLDLHAVIQSAASNPETADIKDKIKICVLTQAVIDRHLGTELATVIPAQRAAASSAATTLHQSFAETQTSQDKLQQRERVAKLGAAIALYENAIWSANSDYWESIAPAWLNSANWPFTEEPPEYDSTLVQIKSLSDAQQLLAAQLPDGERKKQLYRASYFNATMALNSQDRQVVAEAYAAIGDAARALGDDEAALLAYSAAHGNGFSPSWVTGNFDFVYDNNPNVFPDTERTDIDALLAKRNISSYELTGMIRGNASDLWAEHGLAILPPDQMF